MSKADPTVKLILLGNGSVGKTSIIARFIEDGFAKVYKQTVGLDFFEKLITLRGDKRAKLQLWDIGGQSIGSQMLGKYIYGSDIIFLCYDVTDRQSFTDVEDWLGMVRTTFSPSNPEYEEKKKQPMIFLCGNKIDLDHLRKIPEEVHDKFVRQNRLHDGFFTSAQSGDNVTPVFYDAAGKSLGIKLSAFELEFHKKILSVTVAKDEERGNGDNDVAKQMEEEDLAQGGTFQDMLDRAAAEEKKGKKRCCLF